MRFPDPRLVFQAEAIECSLPSSKPSACQGFALHIFEFCAHDAGQSGAGA